MTVVGDLETVCIGADGAASMTEFEVGEILCIAVGATSMTVVGET